MMPKQLTNQDIGCENGIIDNESWFTHSPKDLKVHEIQLRLSQIPGRDVNAVSALLFCEKCTECAEII